MNEYPSYGSGPLTSYKEAKQQLAESTNAQTELSNLARVLRLHIAENHRVGVYGKVMTIELLLDIINQSIGVDSDYDVYARLMK